MYVKIYDERDAISISSRAGRSERKENGKLKSEVEFKGRRRLFREAWWTMKKERESSERPACTRFNYPCVIISVNLAMQVEL